MDTKALKKQMGAAIAMVLVAAVALGSATFAWVVTNNTVKATTSTISAQSNAAFMTIAYNATAVNGNDTQASANEQDTKLYPSTYCGGNETSINDQNKGQFMFGYGTGVDSNGYTIDANGVKVVGSTGSIDEAVNAQYAVKYKFNISSRGQDLSNLKVADNGISVAENDSSNSKINSALRILVKCGDNWDVYDKSGTWKYGSGESASTLAAKVSADQDTEVDLILFYEGSDKEIYTNNLTKLEAASNKITVQFTATADNK